MSQDTVSIFDVVEVNKALARHGLSYKVHMHDTCGGQTFELRPMSDERETPSSSGASGVGLLDAAKQDAVPQNAVQQDANQQQSCELVREFFEARGWMTVFTDDAASFRLRSY